MLIKKKSLVVIFLSGLVIASVLVLTLVGYVIYVEFKSEDFRRSYQDLLQKLNAKTYSRYIEISKLDSRIESAGALKGKPIIEGVVSNKGAKDITGLLIKVKFLDRNGAIIYEVIFHPEEPSLGTSILTQVPIPYFSVPAKVIIKSKETLPFKKILTNCPKEILTAGGRWPGGFSSEILSADFKI